MQSVPAEVWRGYALAFGDDAARMAQVCPPTNAGFTEAAAAAGAVERSCCICGASFTPASREGCRASRHSAPANKRTPFFDAREQKVLMLFTHGCCGKPLGQPGCVHHDGKHRSVDPDRPQAQTLLEPAESCPTATARSPDGELSQSCLALEREARGHRRWRRRKK